MDTLYVWSFETLTSWREELEVEYYGTLDPKYLVKAADIAGFIDPYLDRYLYKRKVMAESEKADFMEMPDLRMSYDATSETLTIWRDD